MISLHYIKRFSYEQYALGILYDNHMYENKFTHFIKCATQVIYRFILCILCYILYSLFRFDSINTGISSFIQIIDKH